MKRTSIAYLEITLAMIGAGSSVLPARELAGALPGFAVVFGRFLIAAPLLLAPMLMSGERPRPRRDEIAALIAMAATGAVGFNAFLVLGLRHVGPGTAGIVIGASPAVIAAGAALFLGERFGRREAVAIGLAVAGVVAVAIGGSDRGGGSAPVIGTLLVSCVVLCEASFSLLGKRVTDRLGAVATSTFVALFGAALTAPVALWQAGAIDFGAIDGRAWFALVYYGAPATVGTYLLWYDGLRWAPASRAAMFTGLMPISAVLLSALLYGDRIGELQLLGMAAVLAAIYAGVGRSSGADDRARTIRAATEIKPGVSP